MRSHSPVSTRSAPVPDAQAAKSRRPARRVVFALSFLLLIAVAAAVILPSAWQATLRREAYLPQLEAMAAREPSNGPLLAILAARQMQAGELPSASDTLEQAVIAGEKTAPVWLCLAATRAALGDPSAPNDLRVGAQDTDSPDLSAAQARLAALPPTAGNDTLAAAISPQGARPLLDAYAGGSFLNGLVEWWGRLRPERSGFATRETWAAQEPNNAQAQRLWGLALLENRRLPDAASVLAHAAALAPHSPDVALALGELSEQEGQLGQAALEYVACLRSSPRSLPALLGLGRTLLALQLPATAAKVYLTATKVDPNSAEAWIGTGKAGNQALDGLGYTLSSFRNAVRLEPNLTDFYPFYAITLRQNGRWSEAQAVLQRRLKAAPEDAYAHYLLGQILLRNDPSPAGLARAAIETQTALDLAPQSAVPDRQQMAEILLSEHHPQQAAVWLRQVLTQEPNNQSALSELAHADQESGLTAQAQAASAKAAALSLAADQAKTLTYAVAADPGNMILHQRLALAYARAGQTDNARQQQQLVDWLRTHPNMRGQGTETLQTVVEAVLPK